MLFTDLFIKAHDDNQETLCFMLSWFPPDSNLPHGLASVPSKVYK